MLNQSDITHKMAKGGILSHLAQNANQEAMEIIE